MGLDCSEGFERRAPTTNFQPPFSGQSRMSRRARWDTHRDENAAPLTPQSWGEPHSPRSRGAGGAIFGLDPSTAPLDLVRDVLRTRAHAASVATTDENLWVVIARRGRYQKRATAPS